MTGKNPQSVEAIRRSVADARAVPVPPPAAGSAARSAMNRALARHDRNDVGNAERLAARYGADILFVREIGAHVWSGRHWQRVGADAAVRRMAHETAKAIVEEVAAAQEGDPEEWGGKAACDQLQQELFAWSKKSGDRRRIEAMIVEAQPYLSVGPEALDQDPMVINLMNGTLPLEGSCDRIRPHAREDRLAKVMNVVFDPEADCPEFHKFLARVQPDETRIGFLQRWSGYCLTGRTSERKLVFNYGEGANGKSTFVDIIARVMGPYAASLPFTSLVRDDRKRGADATPDLARLPGARLVRASEPERGARFAEASVKAITGGEEITARNLREGFFDFVPQFKLMLSGNHKPVIRGQDRGIWSRFLLVPWEVSIPEAEWDKTLPKKLWAERVGILNWMLDGTRMWLEGGLGIPDSVRGATDQYRTDSDQLGRFIAMCVEHLSGSKVAAADMYDAFRRWCLANGENIWTQTSFGRALGDRNFKKETTGGYVHYLDVNLVNVPDAPGRDGGGAAD